MVAMRQYSHSHQNTRGGVKRKAELDDSRENLRVGWKRNGQEVCDEQCML